MISADVVIEYKEGMTGDHFDVVGIDLMIIPLQVSSDITVKQKRWPDWELNPGPSRHIPDALTTELSGLLPANQLTY